MSIENNNEQLFIDGAPFYQNPNSLNNNFTDTANTDYVSPENVVDTASAAKNWSFYSPYELGIEFFGENIIDFVSVFDSELGEGLDKALHSVKQNVDNLGINILPT